MRELLSSVRGPHGFVDTTCDGVVKGWVASHESECTYTILLTIDGEICGVARADRVRLDLLSAGYSSSNHGFELAIPAKFQDGCVHRVEIAIDGFGALSPNQQVEWVIEAAKECVASDTGINQQDGNTDLSKQANDDLLVAHLPVVANTFTPMTNVLFYVEPVTFRNDPSMLMTWAEWIRSIASRNSSVNFVMVANAYICDSILPLPDNIRTICIRGYDLLSHTKYSLSRYVLDLHQCSGGWANQPLIDRLVSIANDVDPQMVISFSENGYLKKCFPRSEVLFSELGTLPQYRMPASLFFDPVGHQSGLLSLHSQTIIHLDPPLSVHKADTLWNSVVERIYRASDEYAYARDWLKSLRARHLVLVALQPPDHPNYSDFVQACKPVELLTWTAQTYSDSIVIPTFHRDSALSEEHCYEIEHHFPNVRFLPRSIGIGRSEFLVEMMDEVVTLSSSVGFTALLQGVPTRSLAQNRFQTLSTTASIHRNGGEHRQLRRNLLALFSNGYLHRLDDIISIDDLFTRQIIDILPNERVKLLQDFSGWHLSSLEKLLGLS